MEDEPNAAVGKDVETSSGDKKVDDDNVGEQRSGVLEDEEIGPPTVGMVFTSEEEVRNYYSKYAHCKGFGIYRRSSRCGDDGKVKYFTLACANAGKVRQTNRNNKFPRRQSAKTNCKAKINVQVESDIRVYVCHVVLEHNHELSPGKVQRDIRKKVWSPRMTKKGERKEQVGIISCYPAHPNAGKVMGCENLSSGEHWNYDCSNCLMMLVGQ